MKQTILTIATLLMMQSGIAQEFDFGALGHLTKFKRYMNREEMIANFGYPDGTDSNTNFKNYDGFVYKIMQYGYNVIYFKINFHKGSLCTGIEIGNSTAYNIQLSNTVIDSLTKYLGDNNPLFNLYGKDYNEAIKLLGKPTEKGKELFTATLRWFKGYQAVGITYYTSNDKLWDKSMTRKGKINHIYIYFNNKEIFKRG